MIRNVHSELGQGRYSSCPNDSVLEDDSVVDVSNVFRGLKRLGSFDSEQVKDSNGKFCELAVFDELAQLSESCSRDGDVSSCSWSEDERGNSPASFESEMNLIMSKIASTTDRLKSYPPSSRRTPERKLSMTDCLAGNLRQRARIALTTMTLNSSEISLMNCEICFMRRSTDASLPVLRRVVMAKVATLRLSSLISFSISRLQV